MSFWGLTKYKKSSQKTNKQIKNMNSLQAQKDKTTAYTDIFYILNPKRMSPISFKMVKAAISIEAAIAVPLFLFFLINVISIINAYDCYGKSLAKVQQQARVASFESHNIDDRGDEMILCSEQVPVSSLFSSLGFRGDYTVAVMSYRKWTGYDVLHTKNQNDIEEYVYITEHGTSYHRNRECMHLKITILITDIDGIHQKRNASGGIYSPCERCGGNGTGVVFYTPEGNRYHSAANCSGLKRTIKLVKLSEVGGRKACKSCG